MDISKLKGVEPVSFHPFSFEKPDNIEFYTQGHEIISPAVDEVSLIKKRVEAAGRTCYQSEDKITEESCDPFIKRIIARGHESVLEHGNITVRLITNRGVTHELVRHRLASYSQESTRYCKYGSNMVFIWPVWLREPMSAALQSDMSSFKVKAFVEACAQSKRLYDQLLYLGCSAQEAREVLNNALKTEIVTSANIRQWRTIFKQRCAPAAHPQMRALMIPLLNELKEMMPIFFEDIEI